MNEPQTAVKPDVQERLLAANVIVRARLRTWGPTRVLHGSALGLILLSVILPIANVAQFGLFISTTSSMRFYDFGLWAWVVVLFGVGLAGAPFVLSLGRLVGVAAFGLACVGLGALIVPFAVSSALANFAQLAPGYYALTLAFGLLIFAYWQRCTNGVGPLLGSPDVVNDG